MLCAKLVVCRGRATAYRGALAGRCDRRFVEQWPGSLEDARVRWPKGIAVGKLAVVKAPGKSPRLAGDSSVCGPNARSKILERVEYPTIFEVESALASGTGASPELAAIVIDVAAAHKRVKLQEADCVASSFFR